jgi:hypothetical protein
MRVCLLNEPGESRFANLDMRGARFAPTPDGIARSTNYLLNADVTLYTPATARCQLAR